MSRKLFANLLTRFETAYKNTMADGDEFGLLGYAETYRYRLEDIREDEFLEILVALRREVKQ